MRIRSNHDFHHDSAEFSRIKLYGEWVKACGIVPQNLGDIMRSDALLVSESQLGDREAFTEIVRKYQTLVCSIAYGATGRLADSEELAQETFIAAWRTIGSLRDAERLKAWLCGIVRNLAIQSKRRERTSVLDGACSMDDAQLVDRRADEPERAAIAREEAEIVDRALLGLPETYREPLVLYYREEESVSRVAELLDLSTDAVKQRLSRGRHMLQRGVAAIVEQGLRQSAPTRAFTAAVLASLPVLSGTAQAATATIASVSITSAKGASAMSAASWIGLLGTIAGPIVGILGGWLGYSMSLKGARSQRERTLIQRMALVLLVMIAFLTIGILLLTQAGSLEAINPRMLALSIVVLVIGYVIGLLSLIFYVNWTIAKIRAEDGTLEKPKEEFAQNMPKLVAALQSARIYESKARLLGLPLISVRFNGAESQTEPYRRRPAIGWIAIGDWAIGVLFASGSIAIGGIATGAIGIGLVSLSGLAIGVFALGGTGLGVWALGGIVVGWYALGGAAIAWRAATGGVAVAHDVALGGLATAAHANDSIAKSFIAQHAFFRLEYFMWATWIVLVIALAPTLIAWLCVQRTTPLDEQRVEG